MKNTNTHTLQRRTSVRMMAIVVCVVAIVATAVFGVIERVNVERRFDAIERSNQQTAVALATAASNNDLFEKNYRLTTELLRTMKVMSRNMNDITAVLRRRFANQPGKARPKRERRKNIERKCPKKAIN